MKPQEPVAQVPLALLVGSQLRGGSPSLLGSTRVDGAGSGTRGLADREATIYTNRLS